MTETSSDPPVPTLADAHRAVAHPIALQESPSVSRGLSRALQGFLWGCAGFAAVAVIGAGGSLVAYDNFVDAAGSSAARQRRLRGDWFDADETLSAMSALSLVCWLVAVVLFVVWMYRLHRVSESMWSGARRWSKGWTVGSWFIPIANFVMPKLVLDEIERILLSRDASRRTDPRWAQRTPSTVGWCWWALYVTAVFAITIRPDAFTDAENVAPAQVRAYYFVHLMAMCCWCASCVLGVVHVRRLTSAARS